MKENTPCGCTNEFDAEIAYKRLRDTHNEFANLVIKHLLAAGSTDRMLESASADDVAEMAIRIMGGVDVPEGSFRECCLVGRRNPNGTFGWFCTGVLVHPRIVLTAAHCYNPVDAFIVALDTVDQNELDNAELILAKKVVPHPLYQQTKKFHDISAIILETDALTPPIQIATTREISAAVKTTLAGFGNRDANSSFGFGTKRQVTVDIVSIRRNASENLDQQEAQYRYESDLEFVAGGKGYDSCKGDSGGPAYIMAGGVRKLAGLTSRAIPNAKTHCGGGGVYTRADVHQDFIQEHIPIR